MARKGQTLTPKQARFVDEYIKDLNATQAAIRAGYGGDNPDVVGPELLGKAWVAAAIKEKLDRRAKRTGVDADRVIREYARIAFANMRDFATWDNNSVTLLPSVGMDDDDLAAVVEVAHTTNQFGTNVKVKLHPKGPALDKLGDHLGLWKKDPGELLELFLASLPPSVAGLIRAGIQQQVSGSGPPGGDEQRGEGDETAAE